MQPKIRIGLLFFLLGFLSPWLSFAQDPPSSRPAVPAVPKGIEQITVYIPYQKLGSVIKEDGVYLKQAQYQALLNALRQAQTQQEERLPVAALLLRSTYQTTIHDDHIQIAAEIQIEVLDKRGWVMIALPFQGLPLLKAELDGKPALLFSPPRRPGYLLLAQGAGRHLLRVTFQGGFTRKQGENQLAFGIPATPQTDLHLALKAQSGSSQVSVNGRLLKLQADATKADVGTLALGPVSSLAFRWFPKRSHGTQTQAMIASSVRMEATLSEGALRSQASVQLRVLRGQIEQVKIALPLEHKLLAVDGGTQILRWSLQRGEKTRTLVVFARTPIKDHWHLRLELEHLGITAGKTVAVPSVAVEGTQWQSGFVALRTEGAIQVKIATQEGVTQIDPEEYARQNKAPTPAFAFTFLSRSYNLLVSLQPTLPRIRANVSHQIQIDDEQAQLRTKIDFTIERAGIFRFRFRLPKDWRLIDVRCPSMEDHIKDGPDQILVLLKQKVGGPVLKTTIGPQRLWDEILQILGWDVRQRLGTLLPALQDRLAQPQAVERLQQLFGHASEKAGESEENEPKHTCTLLLRRRIDAKKPLALEFVEPLDLENERGMVGLYLPDYLDLETDGLKGLMSIDDLSQATDLQADDKHPLRQAFRYIARPLALGASLRRKDTSLEARIYLSNQIREDGYRVQGIARFQARFAGTQKLHMLVPASISKNLQIETSVREIRKEDQKNHVLYTFLLHNRIPRDGIFDIRFTENVPFAQSMKVGEVRSFNLLAPSVPQAIRQTLFWGLQKDESLSLHPDAPAGLTRADVSERPDFATSLPPISQLYQSVEMAPSPLKIHLRRHQYAQVLSAAVTRLHVDASLSLDGNAQVLAVLQIQNRGRQFLKLQLPPKARVLALRIQDADRYRFEIDQKGELLIDLVQRTDGALFPVVVRYEHPLADPNALQSVSSTFAFQGPIPLDLPVLKSSLELRLPKRHTYVDFETSMSHPQRYRGLWDLLRTWLWASPDALSYSEISDVYSLRSLSRELYTQLPSEGTSFSFFTATGQIQVSVQYRGSWFQIFLEILFFLVVCVVLIAVRINRPSLSPITLIAASAVLLAFLGATLSRSLYEIFLSGYLSLAFLSTIWTSHRLYLFFRTSIHFGSSKSPDDDDNGPSGGSKPPSSPPPPSKPAVPPASLLSTLPLKQPTLPESTPAPATSGASTQPPAPPKPPAPATPPATPPSAATAAPSPTSSSATPPATSASSAKTASAPETSETSETSEKSAAQDKTIEPPSSPAPSRASSTSKAKKASQEGGKKE